MFCIECGNELSNGYTRCPICDTALSIIEENIGDNLLRELGDEIIDFNPNLFASFFLGNLSIEYSGDMYIYCLYYQFYNRLLDNSIEELKKYIRRCDFDFLVNHMDKYIRILLNQIMCSFVAFVKKVKPDLSDSIYDNFATIDNGIVDICAPVYVAAEYFNEYSDLLAQKRALLKTDRNYRWVGGGFGIRSAIKGKIKADVLNFVSGATHATGNAIKQSIASIIDKRNENNLKEEIKNGEAFINKIVEFFEDYYLRNAYQISILLFEEEKVNELSKLHIDYEHKKLSLEEAYHAISYNPFDLNAYINLYEYDASLASELFNIARFSGVHEELAEEMILSVDLKYLLEGEDCIVKPIGIDSEYDLLIKVYNDFNAMINSNHLYHDGNMFYAITDKEIKYSPISRNLLKIQDGEYLIKRCVCLVQNYFIKIIELLSSALFHQKTRYINQEISKYGYKQGIDNLTALNDDIINYLVYQKARDELKETNQSQFIKKYDSIFNPLIIDALLLNDDNIDNIIKLANAGRPNAMEKLGLMYFYGNKIEKNEEKSRFYLEKAADYLCIYAIAYMGLFYKEGLCGCEKNTFYSYKYFKFAEAFNNQFAINYMKK